MLPHSIQPEYDIIFAGGGTAACVTASRLASAFPHLTILVLETGPGTKDKEEHIQPGLYPSHLASDTKTMGVHVSAPSDNVAGRAISVFFGQCVGCGSSINWMAYNRPAASDLDEWETVFGNEGWGAEAMIPMFQKAETYEIDPKKPTHGSDGPLKVSYGAASGLDGWKEFGNVGSAIEKGRPQGVEANSFGTESINIFYRMPKWASTAGRRSDVAHYYVYNNEPANLAVFDGCLVNRVLIENGIAMGVEYFFNRRVHPSAPPQDIHFTVKARQLRSGIGRKDLLERAGIAVVADIPGVGENYQDHILCTPLYIVDSDVKTMDNIFRGEPGTLKTAQQQWNADGSGLLSSNAIDAAIKLRPHPDELGELGPDFMEYWNEKFADKPDRPLLVSGQVMGLPKSDELLSSPKLMVILFYLCYPKSRGYLHISSSDPLEAPDFQAGYLSSPAELAALRWAYKKSREIARRLSFFRGALPPTHPNFNPESSAAAAILETSPVSLEAPKIVYSKDDDEAIDTYLRQSVQTTWHALGTCAMKPLEQGGVVDSKLNVYMVKKLKVVDLSIAPSNVHSNTYSMAMAIGEKAAVIIAEELNRTRLR
ncbi:hypothetical protein FB45DRAFT_1068331 [Roridomyces roridus]|uniref:Alcohol oxidase n=1 Tax=Roridomyces roridus TaxID=1738132 RepID=A0AAD7FA35_9AGAR|nr:hypothetical protein FB45DRAFT_1068331 [Roridomyces roridus]